MDGINLLTVITYLKARIANQNALDTAARQEELLRKQQELQDLERKAEAIRQGETERLPPHSQAPGTVPNTDVFVGIDPSDRPPE